MIGWQPIETLRDGECVLLWFPHGERGIGGIETAMVFRHESHAFGTEWSFWTHGGPNSGSDWEVWNGPDGKPERPTHWMPLPDPPA